MLLRAAGNDDTGAVGSQVSAALASLGDIVTGEDPCAQGAVAAVAQCYSRGCHRPRAGLGPDGFGWSGWHREQWGQRVPAASPGHRAWRLESNVTGPVAGPVADRNKGSRPHPSSSESGGGGLPRHSKWLLSIFPHM